MYGVLSMEQALIQTLNSQSRNMQIDVQVITLDDNLNHPYFASIDISKDNLSPIGICKVVAPYDAQILQYWNTYIGIIIISFNIKDLQQQNTNSLLFLQSNELSERIVNDEYNYSFICRIQKIKHKGKEIIVYFEDLGWKFLQKVPKEFRETYIANQPLDKAFQAICELLEVDFAYSIEDMQEYNFGADGYSVEKDGQVIETVETVLSKWKTQEEEEEENNPLDNQQYENQSLMEFDNKNKNNPNYVRNEPNNNNQINEEDEEGEEDKRNEELQKEFEKKIVNMFIGNNFYESKLTSNIMNYGNITVSSNNSASNNNEMSEVSSNDNSSSNNDSTNNNSSSNNSSSNNKKRNGWYNGQLYENGKISLSNEYVRTLTPQQALAKYKTGKNTYTKATLTRLLLRSGGSYLLS